jgi:RNA-directed DNA polymerase
VDRRVLHLIKMWLECAVEETDRARTEDTHDRGQRSAARHPAGLTHLTTAGQSVHAPVCAGVEEARVGARLGSRIVTYADDLVILCRHGKAEEALQWMREIMGKLKLTVNEEKTRHLQGPGREFDFLGIHVWTAYSPTTGKAQITHVAVEEEHPAHGGENP